MTPDQLRPLVDCECNVLHTSPQGFYNKLLEASSFDDFWQKCQEPSWMVGLMCEAIKDGNPLLAGFPMLEAVKSMKKIVSKTGFCHGSFVIASRQEKVAVCDIFRAIWPKVET